MNTTKIVLSVVLVLSFLTIMVVALISTNNFPFLKKKSRTTPSILKVVTPHPTIYRPIFVDFFEVTLKSGKKEMVERKNIFTIRASNEGGTIIMSPGGVAFTCTESYEKIKENLY